MDRPNFFHIKPIGKGNLKPNVIHTRQFSNQLFVLSFLCKGYLVLSYSNFLSPRKVERAYGPSDNMGVGAGIFLESKITMGGRPG